MKNSSQSNTEQKSSSQEKDFLVYQGNNIPRVIRLVWTLIIVFSIFYTIRYVLPDLREWITKIK